MSSGNKKHLSQEACFCLLVYLAFKYDAVESHGGRNRHTMCSMNKPSEKQGLTPRKELKDQTHEDVQAEVNPEENRVWLYQEPRLTELLGSSCK